MSLRARSMLAIGGILALLFGALVAGSWALISGSHSELERELLDESMDRALAALDSQLEAMLSTAEDWAHWDDTYRFVLDGNDAYAESRLGEHSLQHLDLDLMLMLGASGDIVFAGGRPGRDRPDTASYAARLLPRLQSILSASIAGQTDTMIGLVAMGKVPMMIAVASILDSLHTSPSRGLLVLGRLLTGARIDALSRTAQVRLSVLPSTQREIVGLTTSSERALDLTDDALAHVHHLLRGLDREPVGILRVESTRRVHGRAVSNQRYLAAALFVMAAGALIAMLTVLDRLVLARIRQFSNAVGEAGDVSVEPVRVPGGAGDELDGLGSTINSMLDAVDASNEQLRHDALHDPLTGLANRSLFLDRLESARSSLMREPLNRFAVLLVDLDDFKRVNDGLGHAAGDHLLRTIAERMESCVRGADTVARMGGDEFGVLLSTVTDGTDASRLSERLLSELTQAIAWNGQEIGTTASIGLTISSDPDASSQQLLREADIAMYRAKKQGKNQCKLFDEDMAAHASARLQLEAQLRRAVSQHEFRIHFQPIVDIQSGTISGLEALIRWHHPDRGLLSPGSFLKVAEDAGIVAELDRWVIAEACEFLAEFRRRDPEILPMGVSVNLSSRHAPIAGLDEYILGTLERCGLAPAALRLEVTEASLSDPENEFSRMLFRLRSKGVGLDLDDFGAGVSSLHRLIDAPAQMLKLDCSFVRRLNKDEDSVIRAVAGLASALDMQVVAEGVENTGQLRSLQDMGCRFAQGRLFCEPTPRSLVEGVLVQTGLWRDLFPDRS